MKISTCTCDTCVVQHEEVTFDHIKIKLIAVKYHHIFMLFNVLKYLTPIRFMCKY